MSMIGNIIGEVVAGGTGRIEQVGAAANNPLVALIAQQICAGINDGLASLGVANATATEVAMQSVGTAAERGGREI